MAGNVLDLRDLSPLVNQNLSFDKQIMSQRYQGSYDLQLRRVSRVPTYSRSYVKGDPTHLIDWKVYAKNDQLIVREDRDEASNIVLICIDTSETMFWPEENLAKKASVPTKWEIAVRIAFHLTYVHSKRGDRVHLLFKIPKVENGPNFLSIESNQDILNLFHILSAEMFDLNALIPSLSYARNQNSNVHLGYLISDLLDPSILDWFFKKPKSGRCFHVLSSLETELDWLQKDICYFDESSEKKEFLGSRLQQSQIYRDTIQKWKQQNRQTAKSMGIDLFEFTEKTSINQYLSVIASMLVKG
ncbi:MAG: DUF58 domain-containing protein [Pseudobacteriovorax sp.]|nr:DUF58 domain-containing protein [Pseudobacteriovorax sp.]